jgi:hypothetical protein
MQACSGLFAASQSPALRIVHASLQVSVTTPSRPHSSAMSSVPQHVARLRFTSSASQASQSRTRTAIARRGALRSSKLLFSTAPARPAARSHSALSVWHPVSSELERTMPGTVALLPLPRLCRRWRALCLMRILATHVARVWGCCCGVF